MTSLIWRHASFPSDGDGLQWLQVNATGTDALSVGGFAEVATDANNSSTDTTGNEASGMVPLAATRMQEYQGHRIGYVAFAAPPNTSLRMHTWAVLEGP